MSRPVAIKVEVAVDGGYLKDGAPCWRPKEIHVEGDLNFVTMKSSDTVLYQFFGLRGSPRKQVDHNGFLQHLRQMRNQSLDAFLLDRYKEKVDPLAKVLPPNGRNFVDAPKTLKVSFPACPPDFGPTMIEMLSTVEPTKAPAVRLNESQLAYLGAYARMYENSGLGSSKKRRTHRLRLESSILKADYRRSTIRVLYVDGDGREHSKFSRKIDIDDPEQVKEQSQMLEDFHRENHHILDEEGVHVLAATMRSAESELGGDAMADPSYATADAEHERGEDGDSADDVCDDGADDPE